VFRKVWNLNQLSNSELAKIGLASCNQIGRNRSLDREKGEQMVGWVDG
jgi:hypothetical protein